MSNLFIPQDHFFRHAKQLKYIARSAFKLLEIQKKHHVIKQKGAKVLDLGCAPGAWLQVACQMLGRIHNGGLVLGVDIQKMNIPYTYCDKRVRFLQGDAFTVQPQQLLEVSPRTKNGFTTVLSDMCPATSGVGNADVMHSLALGERAAQLALGRSNFGLGLDSDDEKVSPEGEDRTVHKDGGLLVEGGNFVVKLLEGSGTRDYGQRCKKLFQHVAWLRPQATRPASREIYLIATKRL